MSRLVAVLMGGGLLALVGAAVAAAVQVSLSIGGVTVNAQVAGQLPPGTTLPTNRLNYLIRTQRALPNGTCGDERIFDAKLTVPHSVDTDGNGLPDAIVTLAAVPGTGSVPTTASLTIVPVGVRPKLLIETIIAPDMASATRVTAGEDGCDAGLPTTFSAYVTRTPAKLSLDASSTSPASSLTLLGSVFDALPSTRDNVLNVSARVAPVPSSLSAVVNTVAKDSYTAHLHTASTTALGLGLTSITLPDTTAVKATIPTFPGDIDVTYDPKRISYTTANGLSAASIALTTSAPGKPTQQVVADLTGLPKTAELLRLTPKRVVFQTPVATPRTSVTSATVSFASGVPLTGLTPLTDQYAVARTDALGTVAQAKLLDVAKADIDTADPIAVDILHRAGPFHIAARLVDTATRDLTVDALDLPASALVTYSPTRQDFTYEGGAIVNDLTAKVVSSVPLVANAYTSNLHLVSVPTKITGRLDTTGKSLTVDMPAGVLGAVEGGVTSGPDLTLSPASQQGIKLRDDGTTYAVFARVTGLKHAQVGWGDTKVADVVHTPGPFLIDVLQGTRSIQTSIANLPGTAYASFGPTPSDATSQRFDYHGDAEIAQTKVDVVDATTPVAGRANEAHVVLSALPRQVTVDFADTRASVLTTLGPLGSIDAQLCSTGACVTPPPVFTDPDTPVGNPADTITLEDLANSFRTKVHVSSLTSTTLTWGDTTSVLLSHQANSLVVHLVQDKVRHVVIQPSSGGSTPPPDNNEPGDTPCRGAQCNENPSDDEGGDPAQPTVHDYPYRAVTDIRVISVPTTADLSINSITNDVHYSGSDPIGSITADRFQTNRIPILGRAPYLHVALTGVSPRVDVVFGQQRTSGFEVTTGNGSIDKIAFDALSDPSLVTNGFLKQHSVLNGDDGLVMLDLDDRVAPYGDPVKDPYAIVVRVTGLKGFTNLDTTSGGSADPRETIDLGLHRVPVNGQAVPGLHVEILKDKSGVEDRDIDFGGVRGYKFRSLDATYASPPQDFRVEFVSYKVNPGTTQTFTYWADGTGGALHFSDELIPDIRGLDIDTQGMPASINGAPAITACYSGDSMECDPDREYGTDPHKRTAVAFHTSAPIHLTVLARINDGAATSADFDIERDLVASYQNLNQHVVNLRVIDIDTGGGLIDGTLIVKDDHNEDVNAFLPLGTRAYHRHLTFDLDPIGDPGGTIECPGATDIDVDLHITFDLRRFLCSGIDLSSFTTSSPIQPGRTVTFHLYGSGFVESLPYSDGTYSEGTNFFVGDSLAPFVGLGWRVANYHWISNDEATVQVSVPQDAVVGHSYSLAAEQPVGSGNDTDHLDFLVS